MFDEDSPLELGEIIGQLDRLGGECCDFSSWSGNLDESIRWNQLADACMETVTFLESLYDLGFADFDEVLDALKGEPQHD